MYKCARCNNAATVGTHCAKHAATKTSTATRQRKAHHNLYGSRRWYKLSKQVLASQPLCMCCKLHGLVEPATEVDHIYPVRDNPDLQFSVSNLQALCSSCHARKTQAETKGKVYDYVRNRLVDASLGLLGPIA